MHSRRLIAICLTLAMCLALFLSACGGEKPGEAGPAAPSVSETPPAATPSPAAAETPAPTPEPVETSVVLSELMAVNRSCLADADGAFYDWIELWNAGDKTQELGGFWLSDDPSEWNKWQIPALSLAPDERVLLFCAGKEAQGRERYADFSLSAEGESLLLSAPDGQLLWERSFPALEADQSVCWEGEEPFLTRLATPGFENSEAGYEAFAAARDAHGALVINEAVLWNEDYAYHNGDFFDWVELRNVGDETILLSDYCLSDDRNEREKFRLPEKKLAPGELFLVFCGETGESAYCHAPFGLDAARGESLYLTGPDGALSDYVGVYGLIRGASIGRSDDCAGFVLFEKRSPGQQNRGGVRFFSAAPTADLTPGIYENEAGLDITLAGAGPVYYTLNGSIPTERSTLAEGPIHLDKTGVIRAVCIEPDKLPSEVMNFSYILNEGHTLPVVSVVCDPADYQMITRQISDGSYPAHITLFDGDGGFDRDCYIKIHGASSRNIWVKKSLKVIFKGRCGGDLDYDLFGNGISSFHSILLRGGYTTFMHMLRDPLAAVAANRACVTDPYALDSRYAMLYLNGKYGGLYCIREAYSEAYAAAHSGSDLDQVEIEKAIITNANNPELAQLLGSIVGGDMSDPEAYARASEGLDMQSLAQWVCLQSYFNNLDSLGNIRYVRGNVPDSRWRLMLFDFDLAMETKYASMETVLSGTMQISQVILSLRASEEFRRLMLDTAASLYRNGLNAETVCALFDEMAEEVSPEIDRDIMYYERAPRRAYDSFVAAQHDKLGPLRDESWLAGIQAYCRVDDAEMQAAFPDFFSKGR